MGASSRCGMRIGINMIDPGKLRTLWLLLAVSFCLLLALACKPKSDKPPTPRTDTATSPWKMSLETEPPKLRMNQPARFRVRVSDEGGRPVSRVQAQGSLNMPLMDMGKNEFTLVEKDAGSYEGSSKFSMSGPWELVVTAKQDAITHRQTFDLRVDE
jgi:hypothetical protein